MDKNKTLKKEEKKNLKAIHLSIGNNNFFFLFLFLSCGSSFFFYYYYYNWIYLFEIGFGPLGTSCALALKILFGDWECSLFGTWMLPLSVSPTAISLLEFCALYSLAEVATLEFLFLAPSLLEVKGEKLRCSNIAIVKWETSSKEKRRTMQVEKEDGVSQAMQNKVPYENHQRSMTIRVINKVSEYANIVKNFLELKVTKRR